MGFFNGIRFPRKLRDVLVDYFSVKLEVLSWQQNPLTLPQFGRSANLDFETCIRKYEFNPSNLRRNFADISILKILFFLHIISLFNVLLRQKRKTKTYAEKKKKTRKKHSKPLTPRIKSRLALSQFQSHKIGTDANFMQFRNIVHCGAPKS